MESELDIDAINAQAEAGNEANADYQVGNPVAAVPVPQLPDTALLQEQRAAIQGGDRVPVGGSTAGDVKILDDGSRMGVDPETGEETGQPATPDEDEQPDQQPPDQQPGEQPAEQPGQPGQPAEQPAEPQPAEGDQPASSKAAGKSKSR